MLVLPAAPQVGEVAYWSRKFAEELPIGSELAHGVSGVVGAIHGVVRSDRDPVRPHREDALAPRSNEAAVTLVDHHRVLRAAEEKDAVLRIDRDRCDVGMREARGDTFPAGDGLVVRRHCSAHRSFTCRIFVDDIRAPLGGQFSWSIA